VMLWLLACGGSVAVGPPEVPALAASVPTCPGRWVREARPEPAQPTVREEGERVAAWDASADRVAMVSSSRGVVVVDLDGHELRAHLVGSFDPVTAALELQGARGGLVGQVDRRGLITGDLRIDGAQPLEFVLVGSLRE